MYRPIPFIAVSFCLFWLCVHTTGKAQNFDPLQTPTDTTATVAPIPSTPAEDPNGVSVRVGTSRRDRNAQDSSESAPAVSVRAQEYARLAAPRTQKAPWKRIIYREINVDSLANAPIYYPPRPTANDYNLFTALFVLINNDQLTAYEYEDLGVEDFSAGKRIDFNDFLDRVGIMYTPQPAKSGNKRFLVLPADIPSEAVKSFYIKEEHFFDPRTSTVDVIVEAICPIMHESVDYEGSLKIPLFWVKYTDAKSFLAQRFVMISDLNNAANATLDDFFRLGLYRGVIAKTQNMLGRSMEQMAGSPEEVATQQEKVENQLTSFKERLYGREDSTTATNESNTTDAVAPNNGDSQTNSQLSDSTARGRRAQELEAPAPSKTKKARATKVKKTRAPKKASSRSVRNRF